MQLLAAWTNAVKHIGVQLFKFLLEALKPNYNKQEVSRNIVVILGRIACIGGTRSIARNDAHSVIYLSVCVAVCQAQR